METKSPDEYLTEILAQQEKSAQLLVRRDLELMRANEKLRDLDEQKSKFISVAAHQLRTPLSAIRWSLGYLLSERAGKMTEEQETFLRQTYDSTVRLVHLVNDLLGIDRMRGGRTTFTLVPIDLHDAVKSVLTDIAPDAHRRDVSIEIENHLQTNVLVLADVVQLRLTLQNIIENAVEYTRAGGAVNITLAEEGEMLSVSINDTGIGIPDDQQEKIFKQFFRARNAIKVKTEGSGLGLSLVRETAERMRGTITFTSQEDKGSTFILTLPKVSKGQS
ncbi:MAG: HAMP domain-containing sensor histidine kinase [bacterium]|nr:HAMP domain-containing sensor histidine kinase [bacterium]